MPEGDFIKQKYCQIKNVDFITVLEKLELELKRQSEPVRDRRSRMFLHASVFFFFTGTDEQK